VLVAHQDHAFTRLDNNLVENAIRPSAMARKTGCLSAIPTPASAWRSSTRSFVSCQRHGKDPLAYLRDVLTRLPAMTNQDDLGPLTPAQWQSSERLRAEA
jgi:hypothetical protein